MLHKPAMLLLAIALSFWIIGCDLTETETITKIKTVPADCTDCEGAGSPVDLNETEDPKVREWEFLPVDGALCRNGTDTGIGIREYDGSRKIFIYMDGGGICLNFESCSVTPKQFQEVDFYDTVPMLYSNGIFEATDELNPLRHWNAVFIPYCTGDLHMGSNPEAHPLGVDEPQMFVGHENMKRFVAALRDRFPKPMDQVLVIGMSAGGYGTLLAYPLFAEAFPEAHVTLLNDSGPVAAKDDALPPCYQKLLHNYFNTFPAIPEDCSDCLEDNGDGFSNVQTYLAEKYPTGTFGLLSTTYDKAIRLAWGPGQHHCLGFLGGLLPADIYFDSLIDLRDNHLIPAGNWGTFLVYGDWHTFELNGRWLNDPERDGEGIRQWITGLVEGKPQNLGPYGTPNADGM